MRCTLGNDLTLEGVISRLTSFEMSNFDGKLIGSGDPTKGNLLYLDLSDETCFLQNMRIYGYDTRGYVTQILTIWLALVRWKE